MAVSVLVDTNLPAVAARLEAASASIPANLERALLAASAEVRDLIVSMMRAATPVRTGALAASTTGDIAPGPTEATITIRQPAKTQPDQSGNWGGRFYVGYVVGGRGPIDPPFPNKQALFWPGAMHPVKHVKGVPPNPYPTRVMDEAAAPLDAILARQGVGMAVEIVQVMKGR